MIEALISILAPHHCINCLEVGAKLCDHCMNNINISQLSYCLRCRGRLVQQNCTSCRLPYSYIASYMPRTGLIKQLIDDYKFSGARAAAKSLAKILDSNMPYFPGEVVVTYLPTARKHIRQRGFDHSRLIAKHLAQRRQLKLKNLLRRKRTAQQVGSSRADRIKQAKGLYSSSARLNQEITYILIDDVVTTGASVYQAAKAMRAAGARKIAVITVAYTPRS